MNIAIDIDGTLSEECSGDLWIGNAEPNLDFLIGIISGYTPKKGVEVLNELDINPILITGRPERLRSATSEWLWRHNILYKKLIMFPDQYYPTGFEINMYANTKLRYHLEHLIDLSFDDSKTVVDLLNKHGIKAYHVKNDFRKAFEKAMEEHGTYC